ncbi:MAG: hypothetical protein LC751_15970 [Actinobacteria bacterium]|nr:hypothetical protein [Actinomycetota bacterium]MCA1737450.1 hypothetical protein [Actinomycetota bacterium]
MSDPTRELTLDELPRPPFYGLVDAEGRDVFQEAEVGGEPAKKVGTLFAGQELAGEFSERAEEFGMDALAGTSVRELEDWGAVEAYAGGGQDYVVFVSEEGNALFHAGDVVHFAAGRAGEIPFPLYLISDKRGESPLISVETGEGGEAGEVLVAALFSTPEKARVFKERATHLDLPDGLGKIADEDGLRRHALVARQAGVHYAVVDPETGVTEAVPLEEWIR